MSRGRRGMKENENWIASETVVPEETLTTQARQTTRAPLTVKVLYF